MARRDQEHTELPYPNGWFAVAFSRDLIPGEVKSVHYFGEDLVVFRNRSGEPRVVDAYCPHLGAHLGEGGRVIGDSIRCPFHGWQYDGSTGQFEAETTLTLTSLTLTGDLTVGGTIYAADGAAATPSYTFTDDTDTGFYRSGANTFNVAVSAGILLWEISRQLRRH